MKLSGVIVYASLGLSCVVTRADDATKTLDYTQRNDSFAPGATINPDKKDLPRADAVQDKRVDKSVMDKKTSTLGDRRAPIDVQESHDKNIRDKDSKRPAKVDEPMSAYSHRESSIGTTDAQKPQMVTRYQDGLAAASASNMARFPAIGATTTAKINRFVFKKNSPDPNPVTGGAAITPAAGSSAVQK